MKAVPMSLQEANAYVSNFHRHHDPVNRDKFRLAAEHNGKIVGVVQVGNPVARMLCDGKTLEVVRLCTDGTKNTCSFLYSAAARVAKELGYSKIITYILESETGSSLMGAGWHKEADTHGHAWGCPSRPRATTAPTCDKQRYAKILKDGDAT